ncbi:MAG: membrane protein insertion efficiency factor YidD [Rhizobacter sp.]|jgi:putative membrane protein insertion efficiency factor
MQSFAHHMYQAPRRLLMLLVKGYRLFLSAWIGNVCRFTPSCSAYSLEALDRHGAMAGSYLTLRRLARCQPWCRGGHDPVPEQMPGLFTRWVACPSPADDTLSSVSRITPSEKTRT